jgi:hypothetical protein
LFEVDFSWRREIPSLADLSCGLHATMVTVDEAADDVPPEEGGEWDEEGEEWRVVAVGMVNVVMVKGVGFVCM